MFSYAVIIFREVLEIALILGVLIAATREVAQRNKWVWIGLGAGMVGSLAVAFFADAISSTMEGMGQEVFNATVLLSAAMLIGWTVVWMRRHARFITQEMKAVGHAVRTGEKPLYSLAVVIALAFLREGSEIVMFTHGALASGESVGALALGSIVGLVGGSAIGIGLYYGIVKISTRKIFTVTSWLLIFLAAGMVSQAVGFLSSVGIVPELVYPLWDTSWLVSESSLVGQILNALLGYTAKPSGMQFLCYLTTCVGIGFILRWYGNRPVQLQSQLNLKKVVAMVIFAGMMFAYPQNALATKKVYSPYVEKGELEFELRGGYETDDREDKDGKQKYKYAVGYGVTDRWFTEFYGETEKGATNSQYEFTAVEWENRFQLTEQGQYWVDLGLLLEYEVSFEEDHADKVELKFLFEKETVKLVHTANVILEQEVGGDHEANTEGGFAWRSKYRLKEYFEPGFEFYAEFGELDNNVPFSEQTHQIGPVVYGKIGQFKYDIGYLVGTSDSAPSEVWKWILEYEVHF